ncbi:ParA family protein [Prochlorococcus marinus]|uniref:ATPases involved in chromosome partitioning n=1 Tax=Prochlorococcus marinus (strain MIT 9211) TaxID=93059 RepID=A9B9S3_PROM4|nr:ParA family protein [Prochlorococcus marinus]ABX08585.1 ATPases involved in chromosome partitioning [Prochlorococcus marinus str. MIT 9211]
MFITVCGQKGGVAKTCTSIHLASVWAAQGQNVCLVDADRNRSALAYGSRGKLPFAIVPVEAAAKASRFADIVITDGQASSDEEELKHMAAGSDLVLLPTAPKARSVELTVELASLLKALNIIHAVLLVKVDLRQKRAADEARLALNKFDLTVLEGEIPLLSAFDKAEHQGSAVLDAVDDKGRSDPRRMSGWSAYCSTANQIKCLISKPSLSTSKAIEVLPLIA